MKRSAFSLFIVILVISSCNKNNDDPTPQPPPDVLTTGWTKKVIPGGGFLFDIFFVQNTGFALSGTSIYRSANAGTDWSLVHTSNQFQNMGMGSASNAIFITSAGKIISTHNGGTTFDSVTVADPALADVFFINSTIAYAAGRSFWKTTDAGYNWTKISDFPAGSFSYKTIHFVTEQTGWVNDMNGSYKTINGGATWQPLPANIFRGSAIWFTDANTGYSSNAFAIGKTTDGGSSWTSIRNESSGLGQYIDLHFIDNSTGYYCYASDIYKTTDGGANWSSVAKVGGGGIIEIHFTDATHGWACGHEGLILKYAP